MVDSNFPVCFKNSLMWQLQADFFYRDAYKNEVDAVLIKENKQILPVEIKSGKIGDLKAIEYFMKKYKLLSGIVLTPNSEEQRKGISIMPFYKRILGKAS